MVGPVLHLRTQGAEESSISVIYESVTKHPKTQCLEKNDDFFYFLQSGLTVWVVLLQVFPGITQLTAPLELEGCLTHASGSWCWLGAGCLGFPLHGLSPSTKLDRLPFMVVSGQHSKRVERRLQNSPNNSSTIFRWSK